MPIKNRDIIKNKQLFADRFRALRKKVGLSQRKIAELLGLTGNTQISKFEKGTSEPSLETLRKLTDLFAVDLHTFITGDKSPAAKESEKRLRMYGKALISSLCSEIFYLDCELFDIQNKETSPRRDKELNWFHNRLKEKRTQLKQIQDELETLFGADFTKSIIESMIDKK